MCIRDRLCTLVVLPLLSVALYNTLYSPARLVFTLLSTTNCISSSSSVTWTPALGSKPVSYTHLVTIQITVADKNVKEYGVIEFIICIGKFHPSIPNDNNIIPIPTTIFNVYTVIAKTNDANTFDSINLDFPYLEDSIILSAPDWYSPAKTGAIQIQIAIIGSAISSIQLNTVFHPSCYPYSKGVRCV